MSQPPYGSPYGPSHQQHDPGLGAPVDPYQSPPGQSYDQAYPGSPAYPTYGDPGGGYNDPPLELYTVNLVGRLDPILL